MSRIRRRGLAFEPAEGWPLDDVFVGPATTRTVRELFRYRARSYRPWDLALWSGVTPQGTGHSLERLVDVGLVVPLVRYPGEAPWYRLDHAHPLAGPLVHLFDAERAMFRDELQERRRRKR